MGGQGCRADCLLFLALVPLMMGARGVARWGICAYVKLFPEGGTMLGHVAEEREGALLRRLKGVTRGSRPGRFGFVVGEERAKQRAMAVVGRGRYGSAVGGGGRAPAEAGGDGGWDGLRAP